jgi:pre-rRNA-processing protein TSR3
LDAKRPRVRIYVYLMKQDDPRKCTSSKLVRYNLAKAIRSISQIPRRSIVLNPLAKKTLLPSDREHFLHGGLVAIDCSWNKANNVLKSNYPGLNRRLPLLLAGNPVSYAKLERLSSAEALAASLIITGFNDQCREVLDLFKWMHTFFTLNQSPLEDYSKVKDMKELSEIEMSYFGS